MKPGEFMRALPDAVRTHLPPERHGFRSQARSWLAQLYYGDPLLHFEIWWLPEQRTKRLELGLHFESRDAALNERLLQRFSAHLFEIKDVLGPDVEAEMWDKGWTKVYEVRTIEGFDRDTLDAIAARMARIIAVLQPILEDVLSVAR
jgi:hypothetical protein